MQLSCLYPMGLLGAEGPIRSQGRVHETYGEDLLLVSAMSVAFTRGIQGDDLREGVLATAKHFLGSFVQYFPRTGYPIGQIDSKRIRSILCEESM